MRDLLWGGATSISGIAPTSLPCVDTGALRQPAPPGLRAPDQKAPFPRAKQVLRAMTLETRRGRIAGLPRHERVGAPYLSEFAGGVHRPVSAKRGRRKAPDRRALMGRL